MTETMKQKLMRYTSVKFARIVTHFCDLKRTYGDVIRIFPGNLAEKFKPKVKKKDNAHSVWAVPVENQKFDIIADEVILNNAREIT